MVDVRYMKIVITCVGVSKTTIVSRVVTNNFVEHV